MTIPLVDFQHQNDSLRGEIQAAIASVFDGGRFTHGPAVERFEAAFAAQCGVSHCVGVGSGLDALHLILRALEIGIFEEVIVPAFAPIESAMAVSLAGATPVLVDVRRDDALIDPEQIKLAITPRTRAIVAVHLFGRCADMDRIHEIAAERDLPVIEDACEAHGASHKGRPAGSLGHAAAFGFAPGGNMGACGAAGAVTTSDAALADRVRMLAHKGSRKKGQHDEMGFDSCLDSVQAAVLKVKLKYLMWWNGLRRVHANAYNEFLARRSDIVLPAAVEPQSQHAWSRYVVRVAQRERAIEGLASNGVEAAPPYPLALHKLRVYGSLIPGNRTLRESERWAQECLGLPIYPELTPAQRSQVVEHLRPARHAAAA